MKFEMKQTIYEELPPLANMSGGNPVILQWMMGLLIVVITFIALLYILECKQYHKRIKRLDNSRKAYCGYQIRRLRDVLTELEYEQLRFVDEF